MNYVQNSLVASAVMIMGNTYTVYCMYVLHGGQYVCCMRYHLEIVENTYIVLIATKGTIKHMFNDFRTWYCVKWFVPLVIRHPWL